MANQMQQKQYQCCFENWLAQQQLDLDELVESLNNYPNDVEYLQVLINKVVSHFESYCAARAQLAKHDGCAYLAPSWVSTFEKSCLWIGGCRPSIIIRLVYVLCGQQLNAHLVEFLEGVRRGNISEISSDQLKAIDSLHARTIKKENKISSQMATVQERVGDEPLVSLATRGTVEWSSVKKAMDDHALDLYGLLLEADKLRFNILKGMLEILTPLQAVDFLVASKKLHLSLHEWSKRRDLEAGTSHEQNTNNASSSHDPPQPQK